MMPLLSQSQRPLPAVRVVRVWATRSSLHALLFGTGPLSTRSRLRPFALGGLPGQSEQVGCPAGAATVTGGEHRTAVQNPFLDSVVGCDILAGFEDVLEPVSVVRGNGTLHEFN
jgi:hypothetical protein